MKKNLLAVGLLGVVLLAGCGDGDRGYDTGKLLEDDFKVVGNLGGKYDVILDLHTGCLYTESVFESGLTPLYDENGEVQGCGEEVEESKF